MLAISEMALLHQSLIEMVEIVMTDTDPLLERDEVANLRNFIEPEREVGMTILEEDMLIMAIEVAMEVVATRVEAVEEVVVSGFLAEVDEVVADILVGVPAHPTAVAAVAVAMQCPTITLNHTTLMVEIAIAVAGEGAQAALGVGRILGELAGGGDGRAATIPPLVGPQQRGALFNPESSTLPHSPTPTRALSPSPPRPRGGLRHPPLPL
jgi:hypothetical protein